MTDEEMTKLCAEAMGVILLMVYEPLHDDAQAMKLVKRFDICIAKMYDGKWQAAYYPDDIDLMQAGVSADLNRAIVECVAKLQKHSAVKHEETQAK